MAKSSGSNPPKKPRRPGKKKRGKSVKHLHSVSMWGAGGHVFMSVTGWGEAQVDRFLRELSQTVSEMLGRPVNIKRGSAAVALMGLRGLASFWKGFGRKYRAFLKGYGLRP